MRSIVAYTDEIDDLDAAAKELFAQTSGFALAKNSLAILYTEEDTDYPELYARLSKHWDFPVIGCTAMAMLADRNGYCRNGISVLILTADDCRFSVGITGELGREGYREEIASLYREAEAQHDSEVKLCLSYFGISMADVVLSGSNLLNALNDASNGLPIYGGAAGDSLSFTGYRVFCNDRAVKNGLVLALVSGNVSPRFVRINSVERTASFSYEITRADGNVVYRLGDDSFVDTLRKENMRVDVKDPMSSYLLSPFVVTVDKGDGDKVEVARVLSSLDLEKGSGAFLGYMPEGATLNIGLISREDVCQTVEKAFDRLFGELAQREGEHSTILCTSCCARFLALMNNPSVEAEAYLSRLPEDQPLMGFYSYGEVCPAQGGKTGREYNLFHNFTFTILAL